MQAVPSISWEPLVIKVLLKQTVLVRNPSYVTGWTVPDALKDCSYFVFKHLDVLS